MRLPTLNNAVAMQVQFTKPASIAGKVERCRVLDITFHHTRHKQLEPWVSALLSTVSATMSASCCGLSTQGTHCYRAVLGFGVGSSLPHSCWEVSAQPFPAAR